MTTFVMCTEGGEILEKHNQLVNKLEYVYNAISHDIETLEMGFVEKSMLINRQYELKKAFARSLLRTFDKLKSIIADDVIDVIKTTN